MNMVLAIKVLLEDVRNIKDKYLELKLKEVEIGTFLHPTFKLELKYDQITINQVNALMKKKGKILNLLLQE